LLCQRTQTYCQIDFANSTAAHMVDGCSSPLSLIPRT
jgi:hypothetical protein